MSFVTPTGRWATSSLERVMLARLSQHFTIGPLRQCRHAVTLHIPHYADALYSPLFATKLRLRRSCCHIVFHSIAAFGHANITPFTTPFQPPSLICLATARQLGCFDKIISRWDFKMPPFQYAFITPPGSLYYLPSLMPLTLKH